MKKLILPALCVLALAACNDKQEPAKPAQSEQSAAKPANDVAAQLAAKEAQEQALAQKTLIAGQEWLAENAKKDGVKTTKSGLQYKVIKSGPADGKHPGPEQFVCVNYAGHLIGSDKDFDSSYARGIPAAFPSNRLIKGWVEALHMMKPGDKWELYIPTDLAYGARGTGADGPIGPNEALIFDVELIKNLDISMDEYMKTYAKNPLLDCSADN